MVSFFTPTPFFANTYTFMTAIEEAGATANLRMCFDFGSAETYPGHGQMIYDLSGNGNTFILGSNTSVETADIEPTFIGDAGALGNSEGFNNGSANTRFSYNTTAEAWPKQVGRPNSSFTFAVIGTVNANVAVSFLGNSMNSPSNLGFVFYYSANRRKTGIDIPASEGIWMGLGNAQPTINVFPTTFIAFMSVPRNASGQPYYATYNGSTYSANIPSTPNSGTTTKDLFILNNAQLTNGGAANSFTMHALAAWNRGLSNAQCVAIHNNIKSRFGL